MGVSPQAMATVRLPPSPPPASPCRVTCNCSWSPGRTTLRNLHCLISCTTSCCCWSCSIIQRSSRAPGTSGSPGKCPGYAACSCGTGNDSVNGFPVSVMDLVPQGLQGGIGQLAGFIAGQLRHLAQRARQERCVHLQGQLLQEVFLGQITDYQRCWSLVGGAALGQEEHAVTHALDGQ